jgi:hypothetical protein
MPARKKPDNKGQQFFSGVQEAVDNSNVGRHRGMPCLEVIESYALRMGLTKADASYIYDKWMLNGFKQGRTPIKSWKHALSYWKNNGWFPSQKGIKPGSQDDIYPTRERVAFWCTKRKVRPMIDRAWGELMTGRFRGRLITTNEDFLAAMEVIKAQWLKEP